MIYNSTLEEIECKRMLTWKMRTWVFAVFSSAAASSFFIFVIFQFICCVCSATTTIDQFKIRTQKHSLQRWSSDLLQVQNLAISIVSGDPENFLFMRWQNMTKNCKIFSIISWNCCENLLLKVFGVDLIDEECFPATEISFVDYAGMILLCLLVLVKCCREFLLPTLIAALLNCFL